MGTAIVHDYLSQRGGAERVAEELMAMWPEATLHTTLYRPDSTFPSFAEHDVQTSWVDRIPVDRGFRALLPLYPSAIRSLGVLEEDLVVSSSSGWAHGVRTSRSSFHVLYCHTPARWLYAPETYQGSAARRAVLAPLTGALRIWDQQAAKRPDHVIANSRGTQERIREAWGIEADLIAPPVDTDRFSPSPRGERLLVLSRLLPYKRVDLVIQAANRLGIGLDVVGDGPLRPELEALAGETVTLHGRLTDDDVTALVQSCSAVCVPGVEDFGIVPVEANAAGKPVVAFAAGGTLETMTERTAVFFHEQTVEAVAAAILGLDDFTTEPDEIAHHASRFSRDAFHTAIRRSIDGARKRRREDAPQRTGRFTREPQGAAPTRGPYEPERRARRAEDAGKPVAHGVPVAEHAGRFTPHG